MKVLKFFRKVKMPESARVEWCRMTLGRECKGGNWWSHRGHLYFKDERAFALYTLRWA